MIVKILDKIYTTSISVICKSIGYVILVEEHRKIVNTLSRLCCVICDISITGPHNIKFYMPHHK